MNNAGTNEPEGVRRRLIERSFGDAAFRARLLADPKTVVEEETGVKLPGGIEVRVVEETPESIYLVLPSRTSASDEGGGELSDAELETVAGGWESAGTSGGDTCQQVLSCVRCGVRP